MKNSKRTKIVATMSNSNCVPDVIRRFAEAGMDVVRLNTAHMTLADAETAVANIRAVSPSIAVMIDTKGPEVRVCELAEPLTLEAGDTVRVFSSPVTGDGKAFQVNYSRFVQEIRVGQRLMLDDGDIELRVEQCSPSFLVAKAVNPGTIQNHKSVNAPGAKLPLPSLSKRDREFIDFAIRAEVDFIAHSFVRSHDDVMAVQSILDTAESPIKIIAKIENREGVEHLSEILNVAYGVMVARGDLGVEVPLEEVPKLQKHMIYECMRRRKVAITATQMLQSMIENPRPTRAEVSDVANAVLDGSDAVMLSGETSIGKYPVGAIETMSRIISETEGMAHQLFTRAHEYAAPVNPVRAYLLRAAVEACESLPAKALVCNSDSGASGRICASFRSEVPVFVLSNKWNVVRQLALCYGVRAGFLEDSPDAHLQLERTMRRMLDDHWLAPHDLIVYVGRFPNEDASTNLMSIIEPESFAGK